MTRQTRSRDDNRSRAPPCNRTRIRALAVLVGLVVLLAVPIAVASTGPLPSGEMDATPTVDFAAGATVTAANVSYGTAGDIESVTVDLAGGANGSIAPDAVSEVTVVARSNGSVVAAGSAPYESHGTTVEVAAADVDRVEVFAHTAETAPAGATIDATYVLSNGSATRSDDTGGVQTVTDDTGFVAGRVSDQDNRNVANATVVASREGVTARTTTDADGDYLLELAPGTYELRVEKRYYTTGERETAVVEANKTTSRNVVVRREEGVVRIVVRPATDTVRAGEGTAVFTVTALDALDRPVEGVTIEPQKPFPAFEIDPRVTTTNDSGQATFAVSSRAATTTTFSVFTFEGPDDDDPRPFGNATVTFVGEVDPTIESLSVPDATTTGEPIPVETTVRNLGNVSVVDTVVFQLDVDGDGFDDDDPTVSQTVEYAAGERVTLSLVVSEQVTAGLNDTAVRYRLATKDDSRVGTIDVKRASTDPLVERFDLDGDGQVGYTDVVDIIRAYRGGDPVGGEPVTFEDVVAVIERYRANQ